MVNSLWNQLHIQFIYSRMLSFLQLVSLHHTCHRQGVFVGGIVTLSIVRGTIDELIQTCAVAHILQFELEHIKHIKHKNTQKRYSVRHFWTLDGAFLIFVICQ
jgi:hypothetical protein